MTEICATALLVLVCHAVEVRATSCVCDNAPPCQRFWYTGAVFIGTVTEIVYEEVEQGQGEDRHRFRKHIARLAVEEMFRGAGARTLSVTARYEPLPTEFVDAQGRKLSRMIAGDCGYNGFKVGERFVVYANRNERTGELGTAVCGGTKPLAEATEDLSFLRGLRTAEPTGTLFGRVQRNVRNLSEGRYDAPVMMREVKVVIEPEGGAGKRFETRTGDDGSYRAEGLPPGDYRVRIELPEQFSGYADQKTRLSARGCARVDFYTEFDGRVAGKLTDADGQQMAETKVDLIPADGPAISLRGLYAFTDKEGGYEFRHVPAGRYLLGVNLSQMPERRVPHPRTYYPGVSDPERATVITIGAGERLKDFDLRLLPRLVERTIEVVVTWADGRPANNAGIRLEDPDYSWSATATHVERLDDRGRYRVTGFEGVTYWLHAYGSLKDGGQMHAEPVKFRMGEGETSLSVSGRVETLAFRRRL